MATSSPESTVTEVYNSVIKMYQDESLKGFKIVMNTTAEFPETFSIDFRILKEGENAQAGRQLILPFGLTEKHHKVFKASLESNYSKHGETYGTHDSENYFTFRNLRTYKAVDFDAAASWLELGTVVFTAYPHDRHFDKISKRIRCISLARDLGFDDMCVYLYQQLKALIKVQRSTYRESFLSGLFARQILENSDCNLTNDRGSTIQAVIKSELEEFEAEVKVKELGLKRVDLKLTTGNLANRIYREVKEELEQDFKDLEHQKEMLKMEEKCAKVASTPAGTNTRKRPAPA